MELRQTSMTQYDRLLGRTVSCTESTDAIVPDSFPDIGRVVCAYGTAAVKDQTPQNGRLLVSGTVKTTVLYQPEDERGMRRLSIPISFAHIEECDGLDAETVCFVVCRVAEVEASPVNSRKLNVSAQLCFDVEGYQKTTCTVTEGVEGEAVQILATPRSVSLISQLQTCPITVLEDANLSDASDLLLLHSTCKMRVTEGRAMNGKVVLKGEAVVSCLALQEDDAVRVLTHSTPFTQILEMPDLSEDDALSVKIAVREADCRLEPDGLLSYTVNAQALASTRELHTVQCIDDLYLPGRELHIQQEKTILHSMPIGVPFAAEASADVPTAQAVSHVVAAEAVCCGAKHTGEEIQLTAAVQVLYLSEEQQLCALQRTLPFTAPCAVPGEVSQLDLSARAVPAGEHGIALTLSVSGVYSNEEHCAFRYITALEAVDSSADSGGVTLILRYIGEEQPLWDIAKACGATIEAIRKANELPEDADHVSDTMLLIPVQG